MRHIFQIVYRLGLTVRHTPPYGHPSPRGDGYAVHCTPNKSSPNIRHLVNFFNSFLKNCLQKGHIHLSNRSFWHRKRRHFRTLIPTSTTSRQNKNRHKKKRKPPSARPQKCLIFTKQYSGSNHILLE